MVARGAIDHEKQNRAAIGRAFGVTVELRTHAEAHPRTSKAYAGDGINKKIVRQASKHIIRFTASLSAGLNATNQKKTC